MVGTFVDNRLSEGSEVGPYRIDYEIGGGAMGTVYAATETSIHKRVAIKVLRFAHAEDPKLVQRFQREAQAVNAIDHPGIVDVHGFGALPDGRPYLVMSLLEGQSLRERLRHGPLDLTEARHIAGKLCDALAAAHAAGVLHRDLKPDNIFLRRVDGAEDEPVIVDFGLAKIAFTEEDEIAGKAPPTKLTQTGTPMGTPTYMAPEQWWGRAVDERVDQYALGAVLYEVLVGEPPFTKTSLPELMQCHLNEPAPELAERRPDAPKGWSAAIQTALAKEPDDRFATVSELAKALAGEPSSSKPNPLPSQSLAHAATELVPRSDERSDPTPALDADSQKSDDASPATTTTAIARYAIGLAVGVAGVAMLGYAGTDRFAYVEWLKLGGYPFTIATIAVGAAAALVSVRTLLRKARQSATSTTPITLLAFPAAIGGLASFLGWGVVLDALAGAPIGAQYQFFMMGGYEATVARFLGLAVTSSLALALVAALGRRGGADRAVERPGEATFGIALLGLAAAANVWRRLPNDFSWTHAGDLYVCAIACVALLAVALAPNRSGARADRGAPVERGALALVAVVGAAAVAMARNAAGQADAFASGVPRAERVRLLTLLYDEESALLSTAIVSAAVIVVLWARWLWEAKSARLQVVPPPRAWIAIALVLGVVAADIAQQVRIDRVEAAILGELEPRFQLFAQLDPPSSEGLAQAVDPYAGAPTLQVSRDRLAIDGQGLIKLSAMRDMETADSVRKAICAAVAAGEPGPEAPDLLLMADRELAYGELVPVLQLAYRCGVRGIQLLLTRGPAPGRAFIGEGATQLVLNTDFVALGASLVERADVTPRSEPRPETFGSATSAWIAEANAGRPVVLAVH